MYGREQRVLLRHYLERGLSKAEVARELGVSRRTVYHRIESGQLERELDEAPVRYAPRPTVARKIDPFRSIIDARLAEFPRLTAARLFEEIRAAGCAGGYTQLKAYVREVRPAPPADPVVRFETPPGQQAQVDFAEFHLPWGKRYALVVVLCPSQDLIGQQVSDRGCPRRAYDPIGNVPVRARRRHPPKSLASRPVHINDFSANNRGAQRPRLLRLSLPGASGAGGGRGGQHRQRQSRPALRESGGKAKSTPSRSTRSSLWLVSRAIRRSPTAILSPARGSTHLIWARRWRRA
jgi:DNA-binding XRE family transcriptional regulator